ncbi:MAG: glycosyltransferase family 39 protein, partial [Proteobacteria bacterium]|nr:glycosyltransferase family 39 protein [Pseudomonadota bacterium]
MGENPKFISWTWVAGWAVLIATALFFRPILPVDETRYVGVAWEMWSAENFLVPHLNGASYSHKPPLLFWLINLGWGIFGVNEWWPRIVAPSFGLGCLFLTAALGRRLWPDSRVYLLAPILMLGSLFWGLYTTLTMFDLLLCFWVLVGILGLTDVWQGRALRGWLLFGAGIGFGVLSKGPVVLIFLLPSALFAPIWAAGESLRWTKWYLGLLGGILFGVAIALAWALPAGIFGGEAYRNAIFWGQSAGRVVDAFDHGKPIYWYLPFLPAIFLPWLIWPSLWRQAWHRVLEGGSIAPNPGLRLTLVWSVTAFVLLSLVSGKRVHYLIPILPAIGLMCAVMLSSVTVNQLVRGRLDLAPIALLALLISGVVFFADEIGAATNQQAWTDGISPLWAVPILIGGILLVAVPPIKNTNRMLSIMAFSFVTLVTIHGIAQPRLSVAYDLRPLAKHIADLQKQGFAIAMYGKYHGQYNFLGRLDRAIVETGDGDFRAWALAKP